MIPGLGSSEAGEMRRKGIIRTKTLSKLVAEGKITSLTAIELMDGKFCVIAQHINGESLVLTSYRGTEYRSFSQLSSAWKFAKQVGMTRLNVTMQDPETDLER